MKEGNMTYFPFLDAEAWSQHFNTTCGLNIVSLISPFYQEDIFLKERKSNIEEFVKLTFSGLEWEIDGIIFFDLTTGEERLQEILDVQDGCAMRFEVNLSCVLLGSPAYRNVLSELEEKGCAQYEEMGKVINFLGAESSAANSNVYLPSFFLRTRYWNDTSETYMTLAQEMIYDFHTSIIAAVQALLIGLKEEARKLIRIADLFRIGNLPICILEDGTVLLMTCAESDVARIKIIMATS